ncbi:MAG TPA: dipeptide epimerase [Bacteroidia bacterium]|jgi:L-alanine-DL-glutamate epimerase-like enolase superfamily enzyme
MKLYFTPHTLFFIHPFKIAHGTRTSTPVVITRLEHNGCTGYGEASMPPYLGESHETVSAFLNKASGLLNEIKGPFSIPGIMKAVDELEGGNTAAKASIDIALHDLSGKLQSQPCWEIFGAARYKTPFTTFTLGIDGPEVIRKKISEAEEFRILKVKLDGLNDKAMIDTIRSITDKPIAVDVNQGWDSKETAIEMIEWLNNRNVLFVEQPLKKEDLESMLWLYKRSPLPLYADESVQRLDDVGKISECFHGINIKLMKCTGMHEAMKMIIKARELNLQVLIGCMSETSCAVSAAAQLTPFADHADLDGPMLIRNDLFEGIKFEQGKIILNDKPGIGVSPQK